MFKINILQLKKTEMIDENNDDEKTKENNLKIRFKLMEGKFLLAPKKKFEFSDSKKEKVLLKNKDLEFDLKIKNIPRSSSLHILISSNTKYEKKKLW